MIPVRPTECVREWVRGSTIWVRRLLTFNDALHESHDAFKENGECLPNTGEDSSEARAYAPKQTNSSSVFYTP